MAKKKKYRFTAARRRALEKARRKWMRMSPRARRRAMPSKVKHPKRVLPVGSWITKDVGRPKHHYIVARKTKYGWEKTRLLTHKTLKNKAAKARACLDVPKQGNESKRNALKKRS